MPPADPRRKTAVLANIVCVFFWGFSFISIKVAVAVFPPMTLGAIRFAIAIIILFIMYRFTSREKLKAADLLYLAGSGLAEFT